MNSCNIITLDYRGSGEPVCGAWLAHHHPRRTGWTPLRRNSGRLSCLSARPPDLAVLAGARPQVLVVLPSSVPHLTVKRAARRRAPVQKMWSFWRSESFVSVSLYEVAELPCKRRQIKFDDVGAVRRIKTAVLCYDDEEIWGRTDGHTIEISGGYMSYPQLVGTLLHESLHDWCRVRGRVMSCAGEHFCMHKCGDPNE